METLEQLESIPFQNIISKEQTRYVCLLNCGCPSNALGGVKKEIVERLFPSGIVYMNDKPYSFVEFQNSDEANQAMSLNFTRVEAMNRVLFVEFVQRIPASFLNKAADIPGLHVITNFITKDEETSLVELFSDCERSKVNGREVSHFGFTFNYSTRHADFIDFPSAIPNLVHRIVFEKLESLKNMQLDELYDQLTVSFYSPGSGIPFHVDTHTAFYSTIISLSLLSSVVMELRNPLTDEYREFVLEPRSLLVLSGESRYLWEHGIRARKADYGIDRGLRISLTLRRVREDRECECGYCTERTNHENLRTTNAYFLKRC